MNLAVEDYLKENIDENIKIEPLDGKNKFPIFLKQLYKFYKMNIMGIQCILLELMDESPNVDTLKKHINQIEKLTNQQIVVDYKGISRFRRKSLIQNRIPFVIEDGQMYLPFVGMNLNNSSQPIKKEISSFSTSAQVVYLYFLYNRNLVINTTELAIKLGLTTMTASRALNELYAAKLITYQVGGKTGRSKKYRRISDPDYFKRGSKFIKSPVKKVVYVRNIPEGTLIAGLDALSRLSMINPPKHQVRSIGIDEFKEKNLEIIENRDIIKDENLVELQVWNYDPKLFSDMHHIDLMSLYASLRDEKDERVDLALEDTMRGEQWYTD